MATYFFVSDIHGHVDRYKKLFLAIREEKPDVVLMGGDILPSGLLSLTSIEGKHDDFINDFLVRELNGLKKEMWKDYPKIFLILGNDDGRFEEAAILDAASSCIWEYIHNRKVEFDGFSIYGYSYVPPTPFNLKDWEKYDVSRYVEPGCISPEYGWHSVPVSEYELRFSTIAGDLENLSGEDNLEKAIFLFHSPPYGTCLDRAGLDGKMIDGVPVDVHIGSIAIKRFIEEKQPLLTLHGHVHESPDITGKWKERIGNTFAFTSVHNGAELSIVRFDPENLNEATRVLL